MNPRSSRPEIDDIETPRRKLFCRHYEACLDVAIKQAWPGFSCDLCRDFEPLQLELDQWQQDNRACVALVAMALNRGLSRWVRPGRVVEALEGMTRKGNENG
jgi:hypothetical protein